MMVIIFIVSGVLKTDVSRGEISIATPVVDLSGVAGRSFLGDLCQD